MTTNTRSVFANGVEEAVLIVVFAVTGFVVIPVGDFQAAFHFQSY